MISNIGWLFFGGIFSIAIWSIIWTLGSPKHEEKTKAKQDQITKMKNDELKKYI